MSQFELNENYKYCVVVHYHEIGLKGRNRRTFENALRKNIVRALSDTNVSRVQRFFGRIIVFLPKAFDWPAVELRLKRVFGIANFSLGVFIGQTMEEISDAALHITEGLSFESFRVTTKRSQKEFPIKSTEVSRIIGADIFNKYKIRVDLSHPELTCNIEIFNKNAVVHARRYKGAGGLPTGVSESAVSLLSSGIDSPVSSYKIMRRGVRLSFVHFHSVPVTTPESIENTKKIVELLTKYQYKSRLYLVPILNIQDHIRIEAPEELRIILYRRCMFQLAERIAKKEYASAMVTGENVGQVASQTLSNIRAISHGLELPILRPLSGDDKVDIVNFAQQLGTFEISTRPYEDCCSLFVPKSPETKADLEEVLMIEKFLELEPLLDEALEKTEVVKFKYLNSPADDTPDQA